MKVLSGSSTMKIAAKVAAMIPRSMSGGVLKLVGEGASGGDGVGQDLLGRASGRCRDAGHVVVLRLGVDDLTLVQGKFHMDRVTVDLHRPHAAIEGGLADRDLAQPDG